MMHLAAQRSKSAASALGLQLISFEVRAETDLPITLERIASTNVDALLVRADPQILVPHRAAILAFTRRHRLHDVPVEIFR